MRDVAIVSSTVKERWKVPEKEWKRIWNRIFIRTQSNRNYNEIPFV